MTILQENIDNQIEFNKGKNLYHDDSNANLSFIQDTILAIKNIGVLDEEQEQFLIDYTTDKALQEFCRINQYFTFDKQSQNELRNLYASLFLSMKTAVHPIETLSKNHYQNLKFWLQKSNPFAEKLYANKNKILQAVTCEEYSIDIQINILNINISRLNEPVLDVGCGKHGDLVMYMRNMEVEAYGIDRFPNNFNHLSNADWLEYDYGIEKWGTIISNLGFANHFNHHHLRKDGNYIGYAKKYIEILNSLKIGGSFHYAPDMPFIEKFLDTHKFNIQNRDIENCDFKSTIITRIK